GRSLAPFKPGQSTRTPSMPAYFIVSSWYSMTFPTFELYSPIIGAYHDATPVALFRAFIDQWSPPTWNHGIMWTRIFRGNVFLIETGRATVWMSSGTGASPQATSDASRAPDTSRRAFIMA